MKTSGQLLEEARDELLRNEVRALVRDGKKIDALRVLRADGASLAEAQAALAAILTADDIAACKAANAARSADPWVETAPGIFEPLSQAKQSGGRS